MSKRIKYAALVYQAGIANVFAVDSLNQSDYGRAHRNPHRMIQGSFRICESFALGLEAAGVTVQTFGCNEAGDIAHFRWTEDDLASLPFSEKFQCVGRCWPVSA